ncbi:MAG: hypothetical protein ACPG06_00675 [Alphaproteobacteria bacterium]
MNAKIVNAKMVNERFFTRKSTLADYRSVIVTNPSLYQAISWEVEKSMHKRSVVITIASLLMACVLAACTEEAKGADLWRGAKVGMSVDEVLNIFPDAVAIDAGDPSMIKRGEELERVRIEPYEIGGVPFKVSMLFEDGKLAMVKEILQAKGEGVDYSRAFHSTMRVLGKAYGAPYSKVEVSMVRGAVWYLDKVDVNLAMWKRDDKPYSVDVTYSPAKSDKVPR